MNYKKLFNELYDAVQADSEASQELKVKAANMVRDLLDEKDEQEKEENKKQDMSSENILDSGRIIR